MWAQVAMCDRLACDVFAEVDEEYQLPTGWYEVSLGVKVDQRGESVSDTLGVFCSLDHCIEFLQMRQPSMQDHGGSDAGVV